MAKVTLSKKMVERIIQEEIQAAKLRFVNETMSNSSISDVEIEELLRTYFHKTGGVPSDVRKLSVLFPILEKLGLEHIVDAYIESKKAGMPDSTILKPVQKALESIKNDDFF